ncbi:MAG: NUDIX hydrolase, partial [Clostridia bacterium]|nr:NUDIX hydrolase [Clostridia bacterium]
AYAEGLICHEISFYFLMKPRGTKALQSNSYTRFGDKEIMRWIPIKDLDKYKVYPTFLKNYLSSEHSGIKHIITDERL